MVPVYWLMYPAVTNSFALVTKAVPPMVILPLFYRKIATPVFALTVTAPEYVTLIVLPLVFVFSTEPPAKTILPPFSTIILYSLSLVPSLSTMVKMPVSWYLIP